jgi:hypothetical protein
MDTLTAGQERGCAVIKVDSGVFAEGDDGVQSEEVIVVVDPSARDAAWQALSQAGDRFENVAEDGRELTGEEEDIEGLFVPSYVGDTHFAPRGPLLYVDCKSSIPPAMRERMIAILVEELDLAGVSARIEVPTEDEMINAV